MRTNRDFSKRRTTMAGLILAGIGICGSALAADLDPVLVGQWPGYDRGPLSAVAISGNYAGCPDGLVILDLYQPPARLEPLQLGPDRFRLLVRGEIGQMVRLERSRDLVNWEPGATVPIPASGQTLIDPIATTEPFMFYRAVSGR